MAHGNYDTGEQWHMGITTRGNNGTWELRHGGTMAHGNYDTGEQWHGGYRGIMAQGTMSQETNGTGGQWYRRTMVRGNNGT
ncbi:hypothetical protein ACOMHN_067391 [Nucella lapillus]